MAHLNGWHRLFVVIAVAWALAIGYYAMDHFPRRSFIEAAWTDRIFGDKDSDVMYEKPKSEWLREYPDFEPRAQAARKVVIARLAGHPKGAAPLLSEEFEASFNQGLLETIDTAIQDVRDLPGLQAKRAIVLLAWLVLPLLALYALAWTFVWVLRGFTGPPAARSRR